MFADTILVLTHSGIHKSDMPPPVLENAISEVCPVLFEQTTVTYLDK